MITEIDICNKAILRLGGNMVGSPDNLAASLDDSSLEAKLCKLDYALIRDVVTEQFVWSFALKRVILDVPDPIKPAFGYTAAFPYPADALNIWRVDYNNYETNAVDTNEVQGSWRVEGGQVLANSQLINVQYIRRMDLAGDINLFTPQFVDCFSLRLAVEMCMAITESSALFSTLTQEYEKRKKDAYAINGSQAKSEVFRATQLTRVR